MLVLLLCHSIVDVESKGKGKPKGFYKVLGVKPNADAATIKKAYRKLALQWYETPHQLQISIHHPHKCITHLLIVACPSYTLAIAWTCRRKNVGQITRRAENRET
jgi:hypothetical protein